MKNIIKILLKFSAIVIPNSCIFCQKIIPEKEKILSICQNCHPHLLPQHKEIWLTPKSPHPLKICSPFAYEGPARALILRLKHGGAPYLGTILAAYMASTLKIYGHADATLIPIPLHWIRLHQRGYNQSCMLSEYISALLGSSIQHSLLKRTRSTPSQKGLSTHQRMMNVASAFTVNGKIKIPLDTPLVLIDDVCTTGATLLSAQNCLMTAGFTSIYSCVAALAHSE